MENPSSSNVSSPPPSLPPQPAAVPTTQIARAADSARRSRWVIAAGAYGLDAVSRLRSLAFASLPPR
jgi:hypothetical protein